MKIKSPAELQKIAEEGQEIFEEVMLESDQFKKVLSTMENYASEGYTGFECDIADEDVRAYRVYEKALQEAGYAAEVETHEIPRTFCPEWPIKKYIFRVSWKK